MTRTLRYAAALAAIACCAFAANDTVRIDGGLAAGTSAEGVRIFKGIPYAAPPAGELRWKEPQPVRPWEGVLQAGAFGAQCPQAPYPAGSVYYSPPEKQSEDCLTLNVWTAAPSGERRPVMVWIHGGALTRGSGHTRVYDGTALAIKGVVVVTINYRLGPLGFLAHPELTRESPHGSSGNYAVLDQVAALKWVRKNIAAFGGDPGNVTIFGESAGSWSVNTLVATPLARGLFHRAIGQSGATFRREMPYLARDRDGQQSAEKTGLALAKAAGANSLAGLRALPAEKIIEVFSQDAEGQKFRSGPNVDGWVIPADIRQIFEEGKQNDVPVLLGSNADEMTSLTPPAAVPKTLEALRKRVEPLYGERTADLLAVYAAKTDGDAARAWLAASRDVTFTLPIRTWARMTSTGRAKAYLYYFTRVPPNPNSSYLGAYHAAEIAYVFQNVGRRPGRTAEETDLRLSERMSDYWVNFAKTGDPNGKGLPEWKPYDRESEAYLELGDTVKTGHHLLKEQLDFLESLQ